MVAGGRAPDFGQRGSGCHQYQVTGWSLDNGGCISEPHIVVDQCWVFLCILHCCMAIRRPHVAFVEARLGSFPKQNAEAVQQLLYRARTGVKLGATAAPDGEEARTPFFAWEEMGPLLAYAPEDPEWQAVVAMRDLLRDLYNYTAFLNDLGAFAVARQYRAHCCKAPCQSNYLLYLEEDVTAAVANAARLGVGLGAVCADVKPKQSDPKRNPSYPGTMGPGNGHPGSLTRQQWPEWPST